MTSRKKVIVPKGPSILYFIKNAKQLASPKTVLHQFRSIMKKYGKVASFKSGLMERTYLVSCPKISEKIFTNPKKFPKYPKFVSDIKKLQALIGKGLLATETNEEWKEHRKEAIQSFKPNIVLKRYFPIVKKHLNGLFAYAKTHDEINFSELSILYSGRIISEILSPYHTLTDDELVETKRVLDKAILEFHDRKFLKRAPEYKKRMFFVANKLFDAYWENRKKDKYGLIAILAKSFPNIESSQAEKTALLERLLNLIIAGYETTATTISWALYFLANNRSVANELYSEVKDIQITDMDSYKIIDELPFLNNVMKEVMRLYPVLWFNIRYCQQSTNIEGIHFKKGSRLMLLTYLANRNADVYQSPDEFMPNRFNDSQCNTFSFGHGPRLCIGKALAELEVKLILLKFVQEFTFLPMTHPEPVGGVLMHPESDIKVRLLRRKSTK